MLRSVIRLVCTKVCDKVCEKTGNKVGNMVGNKICVKVAVTLSLAEDWGLSLATPWLFWGKHDGCHHSLLISLLN